MYIEVKNVKYLVILIFYKWISFGGKNGTQCNTYSTTNYSTFYINILNFLHF